MKQFLAVYLGSPSNSGMQKWNALDEKTRKEKEISGMNAWMTWGKEHSKAIVNMGSPLGKTKKIDASGISDTKNELAAYTIVQAESHEEAARMFLKHPHFTIFPGDSVEIMECLPLPTIESKK